MKHIALLVAFSFAGCGYTLQKESDVVRPPPKNVVCWQAGKEVYTATAAIVTREPGKLVVEGIRVNDAAVEGLKIELYDGEGFCAVVTMTQPLPQSSKPVRAPVAPQAPDAGVSSVDAGPPKR